MSITAQWPHLFYFAKYLLDVYLYFLGKTTIVLVRAMATILAIPGMHSRGVSVGTLAELALRLQKRATRELRVGTRPPAPRIAATHMVAATSRQYCTH